MNCNETIIQSYLLFITTIYFTMSLSKKNNILIKNDNLFYLKDVKNSSLYIEKNIYENKDSLLLLKQKSEHIINHRQISNNNSSLTKNDVSFTKNDASFTNNGALLTNNGALLTNNDALLTNNDALLTNNDALLTKHKEEKNKFIIHNMDLFFNELYIAFFIFDCFADENKKILDIAKPLIYYNNYLDIYDIKHCLVLDNYINNKFGWILISDECNILKNEELYSFGHNSPYISFSYENIDDFIIWKRNFEESKNYCSNIIKINFYSEKLSSKDIFKSYYVMYKNNMI